jgi:hypothetical protein
VREQPERLDRPVLRAFFYLRAREGPPGKCGLPEITRKSAAPAAALVGALSGALDRGCQTRSRVDLTGICRRIEFTNPTGKRSDPENG